jgi:hypothetical protein
LETKVKRLEDELGVQKKRRMALERKVARLERVVLQQASQNADLREKLGLPPRADISLADIDDDADEEAD